MAGNADFFVCEVVNDTLFAKRSNEALRNVVQQGWFHCIPFRVVLDNLPRNV